MEEQLNKILSGRELPSKIRTRISQLIENEDERVMKAFEGDSRLEDIIKPAIDDMLPTFNACFEGCSLYHAKQISSAERSKVTSVPSINLTYGEVKFESLAKAMSLHVDMKGKEVFYDIGSGSGRGVFTGALVHDFKKVCGVEIVPGLHEAGVAQLELYNNTIKPGLEEEAKSAGVSLTPQEITLLCEDFRNFDWSDADVCWANSTCFGQQLMKHLSAYSERMKEGSFFITLTQKMTSPHWEMVTPGELYPMSWGSATIYIWKKVLPASVQGADEGTPAAEASPAPAPAPEASPAPAPEASPAPVADAE